MRRILLPALLAVCACGRRAAPPAVSGTLAETVQSIKSTPPCRAVIPDEWAVAWPLPVRASTGRRFKVFFYPLTVESSEGPTVWSPGAEASFDLDKPASLQCRVLPSNPVRLSRRRWPDGLKDISLDEFDRRKALLMQRTEEAAVLFQAGKSDPAAVRGYAETFRSLAEPDLLPYYRSLEPEFWAWVNAGGGPVKKP
jgi:hypothetical protein